MKNIRKYFFRVRKDLLILLLVAFLTYFLIEFVLTRYNEIFSGAYKIGQFFTTLCMSYISAFIFYFIVVHIKNEKDRENINEYLGLKVSDILTSAHLFIQPILQIENKKASFDSLDVRHLHKLLSTIDRSGKVSHYSINGEEATWMDWWEYLKDSTFKSLKEIYIRYYHVDSELIKLLTRIENSLFFSQWDLLYYNQHDLTFGLYSTQIKMYLIHIEALQEYHDKNLTGYKSITNEFIGYKQE